MGKLAALSLLLIGFAIVGCSPFVVSATLVPNTPTHAMPTPTEASNAQIPQQVTPEMAGVCRITPIFESGVNVRDKPAGNITMQLPQNDMVSSDARASVDNEMWYRIYVNGAAGWVAGTFVSLRGTCENLKIEAVEASSQSLTGGVIPPNFVPASYDRDTYEIVVDADVGTTFDEQISYPQGDQIDRLWLTANAINGERLFTLQVTCDGIGIEGLRWGTPDNPVMGCNRTLNVTFSPQITQRNIMITIPDGSIPGAVRYRFVITPAAPSDAEAFLFPLHKDSGGQVSEVVSYPSGDTTDVYVIRVEDFVSEGITESERTFTVYIVCDGANTTSVRWGEPSAPRFLCDQPVSMRFDASEPQRTIAVTLPEGSSSGYLTYSLVAVPVAPADNDVYFFTVDRNAGGQFGESISSPQGDTTDVIQFAVSNLTGVPPHNFRQIRLTMLCSGAGIELVRWNANGDNNRQCGETIIVPVMHDAAPQTFTITVPQGSAYVNYIVLAQPIVR